MAESLLFVVGGLVALVAGGELLIRGAAALAVLARISAAVVGITVVALGTSMPELVVSVQSAAAGKPGLAVGNVVGSNLFNLAAILGLAACVRPLVVEGRGARRDAVVMLVAAVALLGVAWNGTIGRGEGVVLLAAQAAFMAYLLRASRSAGESAADASGAPVVPAGDCGWGRALVALVAGALLLAIGSTALVRGASVVASALSIFPDWQKWNRDNFSQYFEVFLDVPLETVIERDSKGIYKRALSGEMDNVVGIDIPFPKPPHPDMTFSGVDALQPADQHLGGRVLLALAADQDSLGVQDGLAEDLHAGSLERVAGFDDVGDRVRDAQAHGGFHGAVEADHLGLDTAVGEVAAEQSVIAGGEALAFELFDRGEVAHGSGEAERGGREAQREQLFGFDLGVEEQVSAGDADVERALADIDGDVAGAEEEEFNVVVRVHHDQLAGVAALAVAGLGEHGGSGFGQGSLVRDGNSQHWEGLSC